MTDAWKIYAEVSKPVAKAALVAHEDALDWPADWVVTGMEVADHLPDEWTFEVYLDHRPSEEEMARVAALFEDGPPEFTVEKLPETDWVTESQKGVDPIRAGRFHVRTPDHQPDPELVDFVIPASQAFGTGQHETTAGCLAMLDLMKREGVVSRNHIDVGTGTGLLAFAAMELWPHARATASDIDPVCAGVVRDNMVGNFVPEGDGPGELTMGWRPRCCGCAAPMTCSSPTSLPGRWSNWPRPSHRPSHRGAICCSRGCSRRRSRACAAPIAHSVSGSRGG